MSAEKCTAICLHNRCGLQRVPKLALAFASNTRNSWILMKYRALHYLTVTHRRTYYERALPCVLGVTSL